MAVTCASPAVLLACNVSSGKIVQIEAQRQGCWCLALNATRTLVATAGWSCEVKVYRISQPLDQPLAMTLVSTIRTSSALNSVVFHPHNSGTVLFGENTGSIHIGDAETGAITRVITGHGPNSAINRLRFSVDGRLLLSCSWDSTAKLFEFWSGKNLRTFSDRAQTTIHDAHFFLRDTCVVTASTYVTLWRLTGEKLKEFRLDQSAWSLALLGNNPWEYVLPLRAVCMAKLQEQQKRAPVDLRRLPAHLADEVRHPLT
eukprot:TRINITY_DN6932_c0_g1_i2.p1 TRINITY_DN6932_c0_g1~~TRINITY_DN6932_c0_g1_i2.p1  ORF type:complete len:258 (-),score=49.58 TRINITY_DN6932_c0_g1_i2:50-823(-)